MTSEKSGNTDTNIRQNRLQDKKGIKKQRWTLYNDKGDNTTEIITLINVYAPNQGALKYIKQLLT